MPTDGPARPHPKAASTKPGRPRRQRRFYASAKQWAVLRQTKGGPCRICGDPGSNGAVHSRIHLHHVVSRQDGGDDVADNLAPLCPTDHDLVTRRDPAACRIFLATLTDAEYAYAIGRGGEAFFERAYGLVYERQTR